VCGLFIIIIVIDRGGPRSPGNNRGSVPMGFVLSLSPVPRHAVTEDPLHDGHSGVINASSLGRRYRQVVVVPMHCQVLNIVVGMVNVPQGHK